MPDNSTKYRPVYQRQEISGHYPTRPVIWTHSINVVRAASQLNFLRYNKTDLPAHAYAVSASAFWALHDDGRFVGKCTNSQSILIGGESGSGKSYTASILLEHLTATTATASGEKTQLGIDRIDAATECATESAGFRAEWHSSLHELAACQRAVLGSFGNTWTVSSSIGSRSYETHVVLVLYARTCRVHAFVAF